MTFAIVFGIVLVAGVRSVWAEAGRSESVRALERERDKPLVRSVHRTIRSNKKRR
jgi:hypothetical protein